MLSNTMICSSLKHSIRNSLSSKLMRLRLSIFNSFKARWYLSNHFLTSDFCAVSYLFIVKDLILIICNSFLFHHFRNHDSDEDEAFWTNFKATISLNTRLNVSDMSWVKNDSMKRCTTFFSCFFRISLCSSCCFVSNRSISCCFFASRLIDEINDLTLTSNILVVTILLFVRFFIKNCLTSINLMTWDRFMINWENWFMIKKENWLCKILSCK